MLECAVSGKLVKKVTSPRNYLYQYASVEISKKNIDFCYHFKLWNTATMSLCILVKEDSQILRNLNEGDTLNMKYYASDSQYDAEYRKTTIRHITKNDHGRFKGHCLVHLEILENQDSETTH